MGYLTINSQFNPLSFDEMAKPLLMYQQAYQNAEDVLSTAQAQASSWKERLNGEDKNSKASNIYNQYMSSVNDSMNQLQEQGLTSSTRQNIMNARHFYAQNILPIADAYKRKDTDAANIQQIKLQDPSRIIDRDPLSISIDDYIENPNQRFNSLSLKNDVYEKARQAVASTAMKINKVTTGTAFNGQYLVSTRKTGYTPQEIKWAMTDDPRTPDSLKSLKNNLRESFMSSGNWSDAQKQMIDNQINGAMQWGIGQEEPQYLKNFAYGQSGTRQNNSMFPMGLYTPSDRLLSPDLNKPDKAYKRQIDAESVLGLNSRTNNYGGLGTISKTINVPIQGALNTAKSGTESFTKFGYSHIGMGYPSKSSPAVSYYNKKVKIFDENTHKLLTQNQFIAQGKNSDEKKSLKDYYSKKVIPSLGLMGIRTKGDNFDYLNESNSNNMPTAKAISDASRESMDTYGGSQMSMIELPMTKNAKEETMDRLNSYVNNGTKRLDLEKIDSWDMSGNVQVSKREPKTKNVQFDKATDAVYYSPYGLFVKHTDQKDKKSEFYRVPIGRTNSYIRDIFETQLPYLKQSQEILDDYGRAFNMNPNNEHIRSQYQIAYDNYNKLKQSINTGILGGLAGVNGQPVVSSTSNMLSNTNRKIANYGDINELQDEYENSEEE